MDRESFWHKQQKGAESAPFTSYYNKSKDYLKVVKILLDPLP